MWMFLRRVAATLIIGVAIPVSVISAFALMYFNGFTLNIVSFGGLALGVGMLVDNSIVVLENVYRRRQDGESMVEAAVRGTGEVAMAITASTLTTIAVFVPVVFMQGASGRQFQQLAYVVSFSLLCSLLVAITVVPALCSRYLRASKAQGSDELGVVAEFYGRLIDWSLGHRALIALAAASLFAGSMYLIPLIGVELQPQVDEGTIMTDVTLEPGTKVEVTDAHMQRMVRQISRAVPEAEYIMTEAGSNSAYYFMGTNSGRMRIDLVDRSQRDRSAADVAEQIHSMIEVQPGTVVRTRIYGGSVSGKGDGDDDRLSLRIRGHDPTITLELAERAREEMLAVEGVTSADVSRRLGTPEMRVRVDRKKATSMGLEYASVVDALETAIGGTRASVFRQDGREYDIVVRLREQDRLSLDQVGKVPIRTPSGETIPAESLIRMRRQEGPVEINRRDQERTVVVRGVIADRDLGSVAGDLRERLREIPLPQGYEFILGGEWEEQQEAFREMTFAAFLALALVYMVMAAQFESLRDPFIILFSIPLAAVGVVLTLLITETTFNMQGFLGVIVLVGIVVNNAIVLIDYTNQLRRRDRTPVREAVITAGTRRLRPILMTTVTTVLGLLPMALGLGEGGELQAPMARVVIGGLVTSTLITLVFIPVVYFTLEERSEVSEAELQHAVGD